MSIMTQPDLSPPPAIHRAVVQLQCEACGAETHAACSCGAIYKPKAFERAAEAVAAHPDRSDRAIASEIGVSPTTVGKARASTVHTGQLDEPRIGRDGKTRKLPDPDPPVAPEPPASAKVKERQADSEMALRLIGLGYRALAQTLQANQEAMKRLNRVSDEMREAWDVTWF